MDSLNYLKAVKDGQLHFADGSVQDIPHWDDPAWTHFFCVRHAEKEDDLHDPELTALGDARAEHLGRIMAEAGLDYIFATSSKRARLTAEPVQRRGATPPVIFYKPEAQTEWLEEIFSNHKGEKLLVVGHQYNIPHLINQLLDEGFPFEQISSYDYGRFFVAASQGIGSTEVIEARY